MASLTTDDIARIRDGVFFEGPEVARRYSRFWLLLILAGIIASAGVIADSTATVIGAMIVAPLMTPILGIVVAIVLGDRDNLLRSVLLVATGALVVVLIGFLLGHLVAYDIVAATNGRSIRRRYPILLVLVLLAVIAVPLAITSRRIALTTITDDRVTSIAETWAADAKWRVLAVEDRPDWVQVRVTGPEPAPDTSSLRTALDDAGLSTTTVRVELVPENVVVLHGK